MSVTPLITESAQAAIDFIRREGVSKVIIITLDEYDNIGIYGESLDLTKTELVGTLFRASLLAEDEFQ